MKSLKKERIPIDTQTTTGALEYTLIIPTLNAAGCIDALLQSLLDQTLPPQEILVVDSASEDGTADRARAYDAVTVIPIARADFDHGGTRDMAIRRCGTPFAVLMTQDALPVDRGLMAALLKPLADERVAAVCARQVARPEATQRERLVRAFRYPDESAVWSGADIPKRGIRAYLLSDVCAAYRREAYLSVGGFEHPIDTNEDMLIAADFLRAGWKLAYSAEARVWHSHAFTLRQEYARNFKVGGFLARYADRFPGSGAMGSTRGAFVHTAVGPSSCTPAGAGLTGAFGAARTACTRTSLAGVFGGVMAARYCSAVMVWKKGFFAGAVRAGVCTGACTCPARAGIWGCTGAGASTLPGVRFRADRAP